ncbi:MAG: DHHA1 domain-containing protein [Candidatus Nanoarchaeia archaeon]|nr:DHHA1 domain-containing protein [Candidatus Nanoarchaeia archaeon]MDD5239394.1 DHHA1 domain-containing protein [Candidatus Nanoarchaeia archaeon]
MVQKAITELKKRIEQLREKQNIAVVYHFDVDGCASASLLWRYFELNHISAKFFPATRGFEIVTIERITKFQPDKIVLVDYIPGQEMVEFLKSYDAEIIDHHMHEKHLEAFDYYTSADAGISAAVSYTISRAMEELGVRNIKWLGKVGSFWDKTMEQTEFYYDGVYEKELESMMPFNLIVGLTHTKGSEHLFEVFNKSSTFEDAIEAVTSLDDYKKAAQIFKEELKEIEFSRKEYPQIKLCVYWVKTRFKHIRIYVDYITYRSPGTKLFILNENVRFKFSIRTSLGINLVELVRDISKEYKNFSGGGHPQACGAMLVGENIDDVLNDFIEKYKKLVQDIGAKTKTPAKRK